MTKRVAVFAGFNREKHIEDYVIYYLKGLKDVTDKIIYVADNDFSETYQAQLKDIVDYVIMEKHGEYDFGSWKRGIRLAADTGLLEDADELIICNDSCYGPVFPFAEMFGNMAGNSCDFWGITKNCTNILEHIQSYFVVFRKNVFGCKMFQDFFNNVVAEKSFWDVVSHYEVGLTRNLVEQGFKFEVYCPIEAGRHDASKLGNKLIKARCPLIKRKIFTRGGFAEDSKILLICNMQNTNIKQYMKYDYFRYFGARIKYSCLRFLYQSKKTKSGKQIIKICKIPVIVRRVP